MDRRTEYRSSECCDEVSRVIDEWYSELDNEARGKVDHAIQRIMLRVKKFGEVGGRELIGKIILYLMREGVL